MRFNQLENGKVSITIDRSDERQCTIKTECSTIQEAKELAERGNLKAIEILAKTDQLNSRLIRKLTIGGTMTTTHAIELWSEWLKENAGSNQTYMRFHRVVMRWYLDEEPGMLMEVTDFGLSSWINRPDEGLKAATRHVNLSALRSFFRFCEDKDYLSPNPCKSVRVKMALLSHAQKEPRKKLPFTDQEFQRLRDYIWGEICKISTDRNKTPRKRRRRASLEFWYAASLLGRTTGLRFGDICCLALPSVVGDKIVVWTDKADTRVEIPLDAAVREAISYIPKKDLTSGNGFFPAQREIYLNDRTRQRLVIQFSRILQAAGLAGHTFHDLRHARATEMFHAGATIGEIGKALGHTSPSTTEGYVHVDIALKEKEPATTGMTGPSVPGSLKPALALAGSKIQGS